MIHLLLLAALAQAHPGGVDAQGCHADSKTGQTHCHAERAKGGAAKRKTSSFSGEVVAVKDGDTIVVLVGRKQHTIRLAEVDCPEKKQAFGSQAKKFTSDLVFAKTVTVETQTIDRYGREVAHVILQDGRDLNRELVRAGLAWWYKRYSKDESLGELEREARLNKRGLWSQPNPTQPEYFRHAGT
jgi:micrococcal nuclease